MVDCVCPYNARTTDFGYTYTEETPVAEGLIVGRETADAYERAANYEYGKEWEWTMNVINL